jgi:cytochrome c
LTAFVLHLNELLPADGALDRESLPGIEMPARDGFVYDDRAGGRELK